MKFSSYRSSADLTSVMVPRPVVDRVLADSWNQARYVSDADESSATGSATKVGWKELLALVACFLAIFAAYKAFKSKTKTGGVDTKPEPQPGDSDVLAPVRAAIERTVDIGIKDRSQEILVKLDGAVREAGIGELPAPAAVVADDGALLLEWTKGDRRVGINVEKVAADSGWYFVSVEPGRFSSASGTMADLDPTDLLRRLTA